MTKNVTKGKSQANEGARQWDAFESWGGPPVRSRPPGRLPFFSHLGGELLLIKPIWARPIVAPLR